MKKIGLFLISRHIKKYFNFLFERGFVIDRSSFAGGYSHWVCTLISPVCTILLTSELDELSVSLFSKYDGKSMGYALQPMIYYLTAGGIFIWAINGPNLWINKKQYKVLGALLKEYIDKIIPIVVSDLRKYNPEISAAEERYFDRSMEEFGKHHRNIKY